VGRTKASKFQIKDSSISVKHAELYLVDDVWYVKDVGSTNGSGLNGDEIDDTGGLSITTPRSAILEAGSWQAVPDLLVETAGVAIKTGDVIRFGEESFVHVQVCELMGTAACKKQHTTVLVRACASNTT
jgi:pSer/pThr/pTyr-binding forkhead associated (FHA) protein